MEGGDVLEAGGEFEAGVQVDADPSGVTPSSDFLFISGSYSAWEQEWGITIVLLQDIPIELLAAASYGFAFGVKEEEVSDFFI